MIKYKDNILTYFEISNHNGDVFTKESALLLAKEIAYGEIYGDITFSDGHISLKDIIHITEPYVQIDDELDALFLSVSVEIDDSTLSDNERDEILKGFWRLAMDINYRDINDMKEIVKLNNINIEIGTDEEYNDLKEKGLL